VPLAVQLAYLPLLADWFVAEHPDEMETLRKAASRGEQT
jgi:hypothetical protein